MVRFLKDRYDVTVIGLKRLEMDGVKSLTTLTFRDRRILRRKPRAALVWLGVLLAHAGLHRVARLLWMRLRVPFGSSSEAKFKSSLGKEHFDLIITHDIVMLPLAFCFGTKPKVLLDAREFYPRQYEDQIRWRLMKQPMVEYLCEEYLPRCDKIITICEGLAREYASAYGVRSEVVLSLPFLEDLLPHPVQDGMIRMIHHGIASRSRRLELMVETMDYVDERFSLDLMVMPERSAYWNRLCKMVTERKNVRIIPPIPMKDIVRFTNGYDVGLLLCEPTTLNITYGLPNKFFEFIQARLALAVGPLVEMKRIVEKYDCGIVSHDFQPRSMAEALNKLTVGKIMYYKEQSHKASLELNAEANSGRIRKIVEGLIGN
jgi:hypothetical protein